MLEIQDYKMSKNIRLRNFSSFLGTIMEKALFSSIKISGLLNPVFSYARCAINKRRVQGYPCEAYNICKRVLFSSLRSARVKLLKFERECPKTIKKFIALNDWIPIYGSKLEFLPPSYNYFFNFGNWIIYFFL